MENDLRHVIGGIPYRAALAGGWIDQPFISRLNPTPPGSMVVVGLRPDFYWMDRCGMGTSTRSVALHLWGSEIPPREPASLVRELYQAENEGKADPSGSQDMAGIIYPGVNRLDYDADVEGGYFPTHVESNNDPAVAAWLESVLYVLPVNQRPAGYSPLGIKNLDPDWVRRLGQTGKDCFDAIIGMDARALGASINECMLCWETLLPQTVRHPALTVDLVELMHYYQSRYAGAMYSGCGGGYLYVISEEPVPGTLKVHVRISKTVSLRTSVLCE
jgi:hypothetical protein